MATIESLPNEILKSVFENLCNEKRKIHHFDPVGIEDPQNVRLVWSLWSDLAAPYLFENMVIDEKLLDKSSLTRVATFAEQYPRLAVHVRRLQRKLSPLFFNGFRFQFIYLSELPQVQLDPDNPQEYTPDHQMMRILLARFGIDPLDTERFGSKHLCCSQSRTSVQRTIWALPNLVHIENTISTSWPSSLTAIARQCASDIEDIVQLYLEPNTSGANHSLIHLYDHLSEQITPSVKSMKLLQYPMFTKPYYQVIEGWEYPGKELKWSFGLLALEHLDIECRLDASPLVDIQGEAWYGLENDAFRFRSELRKLTNLRSLRLACSGGWEDIMLMTATWHDGSNGTHVDDILHGFTFPHLTSLSLVNWAARETRLADIIRRYRDSLHTLELQRLTVETVDEESFVGRNTPWHRIAAVCAECTQVTRFSFKDLQFHCKNLRSDQPLFGPPDSPRVRKEQKEKDMDDYYRIARGQVAIKDLV